MSSAAFAQGGTPPPASTPPPAAAPTAPAKGDELRKAFVDADGSRRLTIAAAADHVLAADKAGRTQFMTTLRAIAAAAPAPAAAKSDTAKTGATPAPASAGTAPAPAAKPVEFAEDIKKLMAEAIGSDPAAQKALGALAADQATGAAALRQLDERGKAILARCVSTFVRKKLETNAIFAGQYLELRDFHPEASDLLLRWAKEAPREVANPENFRTACLRALRDTLVADQATDRVRADLKEIATKASSRNQDLFVAAVCALQQFGDSSMFDKLKDGVLKQAADGTEEAKMQAASMLAELHYHARKYEEAANYYKTVVAGLEKLPEPPPGTATNVYNTACNLALAGKTDEAFQYLEKALAVGAKAQQPLTKVLLDSDHDIDSLRQDPRFQKLYDQYFGSKKPAK